MKNSKKGLFPMITRITAIFLMTVMLFSVVACTKNPDTDPKDSSGESSSADITPESSGEVTVSTEGTTSPNTFPKATPSSARPKKLRPCRRKTLSNAPAKIQIKTPTEQRVT